MKEYPVIDTARFLYDNIQTMKSYQDERLLAYNMPLLYRISGLTIEEVKTGWSKILASYAVYGVGVRVTEEGPVFFKEENPIPDIEVYEVDEEELDIEYFRGRIRTFDIGNDRLARAELYKTPKYIYIFVDTHHLLVDGQSGWSLSRKIKKYFEKGIVISEKVDFFSLLSKRIDYYKTEEFSIDREYYTQMLNANPPLLYPLSQKADSKLPLYKDIYHVIGANDIRALCMDRGIHLQTMVMGAFMDAVNKKTNWSNFSIVAFSNGRDDIRTCYTMGCFYRHIPYIYTNGDLKALQEQTDNAGNHRFVYDAYPEDLRKVNIAFNYMADYSGEIKGGKITKNIEALGLIMPEYDYANIPLQFKVFAVDEKSCTVGISYNSAMYAESDMRELLEKIELT